MSEPPMTVGVQRLPHQHGLLCQTWICSLEASAVSDTQKRCQGIVAALHLFA